MSYNRRPGGNVCHFSTPQRARVIAVSGLSHVAVGVNTDNQAIDFESASHPTADMPLHRTKRRDGPTAEVSASRIAPRHLHDSLACHLLSHVWGSPIARRTRTLQHEALSCRNRARGPWRRPRRKVISFGTKVELTAPVTFPVSDAKNVGSMSSVHELAIPAVGSGETPRSFRVDVDSIPIPVAVTTPDGEIEALNQQPSHRTAGAAPAGMN